MHQFVFIAEFIILLFQVLYGSMALKGKTAINFSKVAGSTIALNIFIAILGFLLMNRDLQDKEIHCLLPLVGYLVLTLFSFMLLLFVVILQVTIKYFTDSKDKIKRI